MTQTQCKKSEYVFSNNRIIFQILTRNNEHHQQRVLSLLVKQCNNDNNQMSLQSSQQPFTNFDWTTKKLVKILEKQVG